MNMCGAQLLSMHTAAHHALLSVCFGLLCGAGTYNNQYIIVDLNKFKPGSELQPGLLTIVEQMPGLVMSGDLTQVRTDPGCWLCWCRLTNWLCAQ